MVGGQNDAINPWGLMTTSTALPKVYGFFSLVSWFIVFVGLGIAAVGIWAGLQALDQYSISRADDHRLFVEATLAGLAFLWFGLLGLVVIDIRTRIGSGP
jgi:hypothetical protein